MHIDELKGYGIAEAIYEVVESGFVFDEETGEVYFTPDDLEALNVAFVDKMKSIEGIYSAYMDKSKSLKERSKDIAETAKRFEKKAEGLKKYMDFLMKKADKTELDLGDKRLSYRKSTSSEIYDEIALRKWIEQDKDRIAKYYKEVIPDIKKKELGDEVKKTGIDIDGFRLVENNNLQIK